MPATRCLRSGACVLLSCDPLDDTTHLYPPGTSNETLGAVLWSFSRPRRISESETAAGGKTQHQVNKEMNHEASGLVTPQVHACPCTWRPHVHDTRFHQTLLVAILNDNKKNNQYTKMKRRSKTNFKSVCYTSRFFSVVNLQPHLGINSFDWSRALIPVPAGFFLFPSRVASDQGQNSYPK